MVMMRSLRFHTAQGEAHEEGAIYDAPEDQVDSLIGQGMAERAEPDAPPPAKPSQPVEPMTSANFAPKAPE
jgi:hypothetical protein